MARILQVCNTDFYLNRFLRPLVEALLDAGHEVHTACHTTKDFNALDDPRVQHFDLLFPASASPVGFLLAIKRLTGIIRRGRYQCVNSHNRNASLAARVAAWRCGVPVNLYTAHGYYFHDDQNALAHALTVQLERWLAKITSHTLSQSREDMEYMLARGYVPENAIDWIGNGIDTARFLPADARHGASALRQQLELPADRWLIAAVGRLVRGKGFQDLVRAFAALHKRHPDTHLLLIGGNIAQDIEPFAREIRQQIAEAGLEQAITLTGLVNNVEDYLAASDAYVLPSYREGVSRSLLEAMSCRLPVVATRIRGCREIIRHGTNGLLYAPRDHAALTDKLEILYTQPQLASSLALAARQTVRQQYDQRHYIERQLNVINTLVNASQHKAGTPNEK